MASHVPTVREIAWVSLVPQILLMAVLILIFQQLKFSDPFLFGAATYLILSFGLRNFIAKDHKNGIKLVNQQQFEKAIPEFEKSVAFFTKNNWIDKYRYLILLSSSRMTYKEMGLCNIAFCYSQTNNAQKAKEYYEQTILEFPENGIAVATLKLINSIIEKNQTEN